MTRVLWVKGGFYYKNGRAWERYGGEEDVVTPKVAKDLLHSGCAIEVKQKEEDKPLSIQKEQAEKIDPIVIQREDGRRETRDGTMIPTSDEAAKEPCPFSPEQEDTAKQAAELIAEKKEADAALAKLGIVKENDDESRNSHPRKSRTKRRTRKRRFVDSSLS